MTCSFAKEFSNSAFTSIENAFIKEYLPIASGESVKVYLYGLFACQNPAFDVSIKDMADFLKLSEETVKDCFYFWEEFGLVSILSKEPFSVQYQPITTTSSARPKKIKAENKGFEITFSFSTFVPKPQTPFQWAKREDTKSLEKKQKYLEKEFSKLGIDSKFSSAKWDYWQTIISRGDESLAESSRAILHTLTMYASLSLKE